MIPAKLALELARAAVFRSATRSAQALTKVVEHQRKTRASRITEELERLLKQATRQSESGQAFRGEKHVHTSFPEEPEDNLHLDRGTRAEIDDLLEETRRHQDLEEQGLLPRHTVL